MTERRSIILDTNLLLLLVVGSTDRRYISAHKNLAFEEEDSDILVGILSQTPSIILTPNTLTETSNLARQIMVTLVQ